MFTGIVEEVGALRAVSRSGPSARLCVRAAKVLEGTQIGDSIAVNGVCLTVTELGGEGFWADVMHETLDRSALGSLRPGDPVNLERAMAAGGRFGGHIVAGHVDAVGYIRSTKRDANALWYEIGAGPELLRYVVEKGSVAIDGVSLTVARVDKESFFISAIPHTLAVTALGKKGRGDPVNLEADIIGKYVEKLLGLPAPQSAKETSAGALSLDMLTRCGF